MILAPHERLIVRRYLLPGRGERLIMLVGAISLLAVTLAVAALVVVTSVMNGFHGYLFDRIVALTDHGVIRGEGGLIRDWRRIAEDARRTPGIVSAEPLVEQRLMLSSRGYVAPALVRGLPPADLRSEALQESVVAGNLLLAHEPQQVVLGAGLAERVGASPGSQIELVKVVEEEGALDVRFTAYTVAAIVATSVPEVDSSGVLMPIAEAQALLGLGDSATSIALRTTDADRADQILAALAPRLGPGVGVESWKTLNASLFQALVTDEIGMFLVLAIIALVAAFNILSGLFMLVRAKTPDIAILRTMGASRASMLRIFVVLGIGIGVAGTAIGLAIGLLFLNFRQAIGIAVHDGIDASSAASTAFLIGLPARVDPLELAGIAAFSMLLCFLATLYPALTAARTDPVKVLRHG